MNATRLPSLLSIRIRLGLALAGHAAFYGLVHGFTQGDASFVFWLCQPTLLAIVLLLPASPRSAFIGIAVASLLAPPLIAEYANTYEPYFDESIGLPLVAFTMAVILCLTMRGAGLALRRINADEQSCRSWWPRFTMTQLLAIATGVPAAVGYFVYARRGYLGA